MKESFGMVVTRKYGELIFSIQCEDLMMLRFSNTKSSMLYNLLCVGEVQMFVLDVVLEKNPVQYVSAN